MTRDDLITDNLNPTDAPQEANYSSFSLFIIDAANNGFLGITDKEMPILIGAAAG